MENLIFCAVAIAETTYQLIEALLMACWLILVSKNLEVRPIGIRDVLRRIMEKAVQSIFKKDVIEAAGPSK